MNYIYAVRVGQAPGIYYDLASYEAQLNGYPGAQGRKFKTLEEAKRYLAGEDVDKKGIYAVRVGRVPGIYYSLADCDAQVRGFVGGECKRFSTLEAAEKYLRQPPNSLGQKIYAGPKQETLPLPPYAPEERGGRQNQPPGWKNGNDTSLIAVPENFPLTPQRGVKAAGQKNLPRRPKSSSAGGRPLTVSHRLKRHPGALSPLSDYGSGAYDDAAAPRREVARRERPIVIYTDGGCLVREDGAGGWGAVICLPNGNRKELSGGVDTTTSERMELLAAVSALRALVSIAHRSDRVEIYTDSRYLTDGCRKKIWLSAAEREKSGQPLPNQDLWTELAALAKLYRVEWYWIKGHSGNPLNERCDFLATTAAKQSVAEKEFIHDYAGQLEDAKHRIKDLEHQNKKLIHSKERFQFLARRKTPIEDKNLYRAVHDGSLIGFLKWKFRIWRDGKN